MESTDAELVEQSQRGDRAAYEMLYRRHVRSVYGLARRLMPSREDAEDLAEEVFVRAWTRLGGLRDGGAFRTWLFRIAVRQAQDVRKRKNLPAADPSSEPDAEERVMGDERTGAVRRAVERLCPEHREVVRMFYRDEMPVDEIGRALRLPKGTVVSRLARARAALRDELSDYVRPGSEAVTDAV